MAEGKTLLGTAESACLRGDVLFQTNAKRHMSSLQYDCSMDISIADDDDVPSFLSRKTRRKARRKKGPRRLNKSWLMILDVIEILSTTKRY